MVWHIVNLYLFVSKKQPICPQDIFVFICQPEKNPLLILEIYPYLRQIAKKTCLAADDPQTTNHTLVINENFSEALPINFEEIIGSYEDFFYVGMMNNGIEEYGNNLNLKLVCPQPCPACVNINGHFCTPEINMCNQYI